MNPVVVDRVSYRYAPGADVLHDVTFSLPRGAVLGLLGANGAGKSTLLQCCAGLRTPRTGEVRIAGVDARARGALVAGALTYVAAGQPLPARMTVGALVQWVAPLHARWDARLARALQDRLALAADQRVDRLSRGGQMKVALLLALAPRPAVLVMDEPLAGLDVPTRDEVLGSLIAPVAEHGTTVLLASHELTEIESVIDHVAILRQGRLVLADRMDTVYSRFRRVTLVGDPARLDGIARADAWLMAERAGRMLSLIVDASLSAVPGANGVVPDGVERCDVEDVPLRDLYATLAHGSRVPRGMEAAA